jgi:hypothetical protein
VTIAFCFAILLTPSESVVVTTASSPSGIVATAREIAIFFFGSSMRSPDFLFFPPSLFFEPFGFLSVFHSDAHIPRISTQTNISACCKFRWFHYLARDFLAAPLDRIPWPVSSQSSNS